MNAFHVALLILSFLLAAGATFIASRQDPIARYGLPLLAGGVTVFFLDLILVAARVYG